MSESDFPRFFKINDLDGNYSIPFAKKDYDLVITVPQMSELPEIGEALRTLFELKCNYHSHKSVLIIWLTQENNPSISNLEAFWGYFLSRQEFHNISDLFLIEMDFSQSLKNWGEKICLSFQLLNQIDFSYGFFHTIAKNSISTAFELNLLIENCILNQSDLNLAAYVIPYYKGVVINFWFMPLSYLFGREIRNPVPFDFIFSKKAFKYWMQLDWQETKFLSSTYLYLIFSLFMSGLRITEFFLGDKKNYVSFYVSESIPELIRIGLGLVDKYKKFILNSTSLINTHNHVQYAVPFNIYCASDMENILKSYQKHGNFSGKKFDALIKKYLTKENYQRVSAFIKKTPHKLRGIGEYGESWDFIFLSLIQAYLFCKNSEQKHQIINVLISLFDLKPKIWAEEIKKMISDTEEKRRSDEKRGFPWRGGDKGKHWHIHDAFEKKLHIDYSRLHALRNNFIRKN